MEIHTTKDWMKNTGITPNMKVFITRKMFWINLEACFFKAYMYSGLYWSLPADMRYLNKTEGIRYIYYGLSVPKSLKDQVREKESVMLGSHLNSYDKRLLANIESAVWVHLTNNCSFLLTSTTHFSRACRPSLRRSFHRLTRNPSIWSSLKIMGNCT